MTYSMNLRSMLLTMLYLITLGIAGLGHAASTDTVYISADRLQLFDEGKKSIYTGNAYLRRDTVTIKADKIEILRADDDIKQVKAWGSPATLVDIDRVEPMASSASYFMLNNETRWLTLEKNALINQGNNALQGERININLDTKEADIYGGEQRAKLIIQPEEKSENGSTKR